MAVGIGSMVYPYVIDWLVKSYGLKGTFLILGGVILNSIPLAFTWHTSNHVKNIHAPGKRDKCQLLCGMWSDSEGFKIPTIPVHDDRQWFRCRINNCFRYSIT